MSGYGASGSVEVIRYPVLDQDILQALNTARERYRLCFVPVNEADVGSTIGSVVDVSLLQDSEHSGVAHLSVKQHYGVLCGEKTDNSVCGLTPGHTGNHHPAGD